MKLSYYYGDAVRAIFAKIFISIALVSLVLVCTTAVFAQNSRAIFPVTVAPLNSSGSLTPNATYSYNFVFSSSSSCSVLLNYSVNITTNSRGIGSADLNISSLVATPSYVCEYINGTFRKAHPVFSAMFENQTKDSDILSFGYNHTSSLDTYFVRNSSIPACNSTQKLTSSGNGVLLCANDAAALNTTNGTVAGVSAGNFMAFSTITSYGNVSLNITAVALNIGNWSADKLSYNTTAQLNSLYNSLYAPISVTGGNSSFNQSFTDSLYYSKLNPNSFVNLSQVLSGLGNWSADKSSYAVLSYVNSLGNFSAANSSIWANASSQELEIQGLVSSNVSLNNKLSSLSNLSLAQVTAANGNWSADKLSYNTTAQLNSLYNSLYAPISVTGGNSSFNQSLTDVLYYAKSNPYNFINGSSLGYNKSSWDAAYSWGNHALAGYSTLTLNQAVSNLGNWSADKGSYAQKSYVDSLGNFSSNGYVKSYIDTLGNASKLVGVCAQGQAIQNITGSGVQCIDVSSGDGTGGWTNTTSSTTTMLNVGIGTSNATHDLDVQGTAYINGVRILTMQDWWCPFSYGTPTTTSCAPTFLGTATSSGTVATGTGTAAHSGTAYLKSGTAANSGYAYLTGTTSFLINGSEMFSWCFSPQTNPTGNQTLVYAGYIDSTSSTESVDGIYFKYINYTLQGAVSSNSARSYTSSYTMTAGVWYCGLINVSGSAGSTTFTLFNDTSGATIWTQTVSGGVPVAAGRETGAGVSAFSTTATSARNLVLVDYIDAWIPQFRHYT